MDDLISKEELKDYLEKNISFGGTEKKFRFYGMIDSLPSVFEGMSNGNVIQAVLGLKDEQIDVGTYSVYLYPIGLVGCKPFATISRDWWNAPYKGVSE